MLFRSLLVLYYISKPLDWKRGTLLGAMSAAFVAAVLAFGGMFELTALDFQAGLVIVVFLMLTPSVIFVFERGLELVELLASLGRRKLGGSRRAARERQS